MRTHICRKQFYFLKSILNDSVETARRFKNISRARQVKKRDCSKDVAGLGKGPRRKSGTTQQRKETWNKQRLAKAQEANRVWNVLGPLIRNFRAEGGSSVWRKARSAWTFRLRKIKTVLYEEATRQMSLELETSPSNNLFSICIRFILLYFYFYFFFWR